MSAEVRREGEVPGSAAESSSGSPLTRRDLLKAALAASVIGAAGTAAAQQPADPTPSLAPPSAPLTTMLRPKVVVIGAGAFGGWTALHLLRQGAQVTLLDAWGPGNSRASSGDETRVIRGVYGPDQIYTNLVARSFQLWREASERWQVALYRKTGALWMLTAGDAYVRDSLPFLKLAGLEANEMTPAEAAKRFPQVDFTGVRTTFHEPEAGYLLARQSCQAVAQAFVQEAGELRTVSVKPGAITSGRMEDLLLSDGTTLQAEHFVFACGPWLGQVFPEVIGPRIQPTRQEVYYFGTPAGDTRFLEDQMPVWVHMSDKVYYGIPGCDRRGFKFADDTRGAAFDPTTGERIATASGIEVARKFIAERFPALAGAPLLESRVCQYENSPDGHFIVDRHPEAQNVWLLGGGSGHGFKLGPALGEQVASLVLGNAQPDPKFTLARLEGRTQPAKTQIDNH